MKSLSFKEPWVSSYVERLLGLSAATKRAIISVLEKSLGERKEPKKGFSDKFWSACGAWDSPESAEELAASIRSARTVNPDREAL
ncbi:MAG: hypothetical protein JST38_02965 [Bacteroidetes bacterium]|nr:hypothetical protein [Bacteroidota bacterium]MBS1939820.1 hypothetical protein [Bacteroidota bacterium]